MSNRSLMKPIRQRQLYRGTSLDPSRTSKRMAHQERKETKFVARMATRRTGSVECTHHLERMYCSDCTAFQKVVWSEHEVYKLSECIMTCANLMPLCTPLNHWTVQKVHLFICNPIMQSSSKSCTCNYR